MQSWEHFGDKIEQKNNYKPQKIKFSQKKYLILVYIKKLL